MIKGKYKITDIIKQSNSKQVQRVFQIDNPNQTYILKSFTNNQGNQKYIQRQIQVYQKLKEPHLNGFLQLKEAFQQGKNVYLVFNQIGDDIEFLRKRCGGRFTLKTVLLVAIQALQRIQYLHATGFLHGDIKPCNFIMGTGKYCHKLYLTDFQLAIPYTIKGKHIQPQIIDTFSGSVKYCSINANSYNNISRRDQLESLIYCMIFLLKGDLPWFNLNAKTLPEAYDETKKLKRLKRQEYLQGLPDFFGKMLKRLQQTKFDQQPPYKAFKAGITALMSKNGYQIDYKYDWDFI